MNTWLRNFAGAVLPLLTVGLASPFAEAQVVPLRTVPIPVGEQFVVVPAHNLGMGSPSVALDDPWQDPFVNPAKGARNERLRFFGLPTFYGADGALGGGVSLPLTVIGRYGRTFGGMGMALQAPDDPNAVQLCCWQSYSDPTRPADLSPPTNRYFFGLLGQTLGDGRTSVAVGLGGARLQAVDGVERLFRNRTWLAESGRTLGVRLGMLRELPGGASLEALVLHERTDLVYDVGRIRWAFGVPPNSTPQTWVDHNVDRARTWGAHVRYLGAPDTAGWRTGFIATLNRKTYPSLPNYDVASVPRDPGDSWAGQAGIGWSRARGRWTAAYEAVLEPAWSHTWATAAPIPNGSGGSQPGALTSENFFHFVNGHAGGGWEYRTEWGAFQGGLRLDEIHYSLSRQDFTTGTGIETGSTWLEWTPSWGVAVHAGHVDLRYAGHLTFKGNPLPEESKTLVPPTTSPGSDYLPPVGGTWTDEYWTAVHQLTISVPVGARHPGAPSNRP